MSLARRGSRILKLNGEGYRWKLNTESPSTFALIIARKDGDGPKCEVVLSAFEFGHPVTPAFVRWAIEEAEAVGWPPRHILRSQTAGGSL